MDGAKSITIETKRKVGNTEKWLLNTCAPALAREVTEHDDFYMKFLSRLQLEVERIRNKNITIMREDVDSNP